MIDTLVVIMRNSNASPSLPHPRDLSGSSSRQPPGASVALGIAAALAALVISFFIIGPGLSTWRGSGFRANGPELPRLKHVLALKPGMSVADVGAGNGELTVALATEVGSSGRVYSTDIDPESLEHVRAAVAAARLANVTLVESQARDTRLPANCCDAIVLRRVYHHLTEPAAINASLLRALRPGGVLAVIDFPPLLSGLWALNHGANARRVTEEVVASGFQLVQVIEDWPGRGPLASYCAVFGKRRDSQVSW
jgi:SAM-dependent methyltransferase